MKKIVVNDTNVFIDLFSVGLLEEFFSLPWEVHTTDLVMLELTKEGQGDTVGKYRQDGRLHVPTLEGKDMIAIGQLKALHEGKTNVSIADCSVWYYAKQNKYVLLTGDRKLRKASVLDGVEVHGIIYVFDNLVDTDVITTEVAAIKLRQLASINPRLPKHRKNRPFCAVLAEIENSALISRLPIQTGLLS